MTLTRKSEDKPKWLPVPVSKLEALLNKLVCRGSGYLYVDALRKNIAYNLQYLEFLDRCLAELKLTEALTTQIYKNFVCVGCGIMESLLEFLLIRAGRHKTSEWDSIGKVSSQEKKWKDMTIKIETEIFQKLPSKKRVEMNFDSMIKSAEDKKLLGPDHEIYAKLKRLRKMRNRIHLHIIEDPTDTDWFAFQRSHICSMAKVLHSVFTGNLFHPAQEEVEYFKYMTESRYQPFERQTDL